LRFCTQTSPSNRIPPVPHTTRHHGQLFRCPYLPRWVTYVDSGSLCLPYFIRHLFSYVLLFDFAVRYLNQLKHTFSIFASVHSAAGRSWVTFQLFTEVAYLTWSLFLICAYYATLPLTDCGRLQVSMGRPVPLLFCAGGPGLSFGVKGQPQPELSVVRCYFSSFPAGQNTYIPLATLNLPHPDLYSHYPFSSVSSVDDHFAFTAGIFLEWSATLSSPRTFFSFGHLPISLQNLPSIFLGTPDPVHSPTRPTPPGGSPFLLCNLIDASPLHEVRALYF